jgi:phosphatidylglycerol:prolipoprotein diacylglycerol transferase
MLSLGACLGFWLTAWEAARKGSDVAATVRAALVSFLFGLAGARVAAILMNLDLYARGFPLHLLALWDPGGMSLFGGLTLAAVSGLAWILLRRLPAWETADTLVVAWTPFLAVLRIGCFLNGCCYGRPTSSPLGMVAGGSRNNVNFGVPSHPAQFYDLAAMLGIFALLAWMRTRRRFAGQLAVVFLSLYGAARFLLDFTRGDMRILVRIAGKATLTPTQIISLAMIVLSVVLGGWLAWRRGGATPSIPAS